MAHVLISRFGISLVVMFLSVLQIATWCSQREGGVRTGPQVSCAPIPSNRRNLFAGHTTNSK